MKKYRAVIFDLDGTLVNTLQDIAESINQALEKLSQPTHSVESFRLKVGASSRELISSCLAPDQQHLIDTVLEMQMEHYAEHFYEHSVPYPGIVDTLAELKDRGLKLAVLSNKPACFVEKLVQYVFHEIFFEIVHGQKLDVPLKPDPTSALAVAEEFGIAPDRIALVGDSGIDMQTARNASMFAVGVTWGFRDRSELQQNGCQALIDHPAELFRILRRHPSGPNLQKVSLIYLCGIIWKSWFVQLAANKSYS